MNTSTAPQHRRPTDMPLAARRVLPLLQKLQHGRLHLRLPDGSESVYGHSEHPSASLVVHDWGVFAAAMRSGDIGFAESFIAGEWETPDLCALLRVFIANRNALEAVIYGRWWGQLAHRLRAIVVEVNNTFGERHCYLLPTPQWGVEQTASKVFHVSPFCHIEGIYRFRFMRTQRASGERTVVRIDHDDAQGPLLQTSVSGQLEPVSAHSLRRAIWQFPLMTWGVIARIHWQALKLWWQRIPYVPKPHRPSQFVTR